MLSPPIRRRPATFEHRRSDGRIDWHTRAQALAVMFEHRRSDGRIRRALAFGP